MNGATTLDLTRDPVWEAQWISPAETAVGRDRPAYLLEHTFTTRETILTARLDATALGLYEAFINGRRVGDQELTPGSTNYDETLYFQTFDVTDLLQPGENRIAIVLSDGWYRGRNGGGQRQDAWGSRTGALAQLELVAQSEARAVIVTDGTWTSQIASITRADLMTGQTTDLRPTTSEVAAVEIGAVRAPSPRRSPAPPVRRQEAITPVRITQTEPHVTVIDFGQNLAGWVRLTDLGPDGAETELEFAEHLDPAGDIVTSNLDILTPAGERIVYRQVDRVVAGSTGDVFEPRHTVHGFRYVRVRHPGRELDPTSATAVVVHSDLRRTGWFECSDPQLNALHEAVVWSFRGNVVDVPTDCPTRERSGWTGDFQIFAPTAAMLYDIDGFARKWLQAVRDDQYGDGSLAMFSPDSERMKHSENPLRMGGGSAGWGDAAVLVPWALFEATGDATVLQESWDSAQAWVEFALTAAREQRHPSRVARSVTPLPHEKYVWDSGFHFGEWSEPRPAGAPPVDPAAAFTTLLTADHGEVATAYLYRSASLLARIARALDRTDDAERYAATAEAVRSAWRAEFLLASGRTVSDSQPASVRALGFDLIPERDRAAAAARLVELIDEAGGRLTTGFLSTGMLLPVLADTGHPDVAFRLLLQHGEPSWLGMLDRGATTVWEDWDGIDEHGNATASLNHYSKGAVIRFLYSHVVGLQQAPGAVGWRQFDIRPTLGGGLTSAEVRLDAPTGHISVSWAIQDDLFELDAAIPPGVTATATLPDGTTQALTAGRHRLRCKAMTTR